MPDVPADVFAQLAVAVAALAAALPAPAEDVEGLAAADAAKFLGVSASQFYDLDARGFLPEPALLGDRRCRRWCRRELLAWLLAGAPPRTRWSMMRDSVMRKAS